MKKFVIIAALLLAGKGSADPLPLSVPDLSFPYVSELPWEPTDIYWSIPAGERVQGNDCQKVIEVITAANLEFERLPWPKSFVEGRFGVAHKFADRSTYYRVGIAERRPDGIGPRKTFTTVGETHAYFTRSEIEALSPEELLQRPEFLVPMEDTLKRLVTRYYDSQGRGVIVELRTNSKVKGTRDKIRLQTGFEEVRLVFEVIQNYPELYKQPIIYTFGDEEHVRLYRRYGFEIQTLLTPEAEPIIMIDPATGQKTNWWYLAVTPERFEANLFSLRGSRILSGLNQPHPATLANGVSFLTETRSLISFDDQERLAWATPGEEIEVYPGLFAGPGARIRWDENQVMTISKTSRPYTVQLSRRTITFPANSWLGFEPNPYLRERFDVRNNQVYALDGSNIRIASTASVILDHSNSTLKIARIENDVDFGDGIVAMGGTGLSVAIQNGNYEWHTLTLAHPVTIRGTPCPTSSYLRKDPSGEWFLSVPKVPPERGWQTRIFLGTFSN